MLVNEELKREAYKIVYSNDIDAVACDTHSFNFGGSITTDPDAEFSGKSLIFCGDASNVNFKRVLGHLNIDVIASGVPCKDFSLL